MAKLTYNVITQEVSWDCPNCQHINSFNVKERLITIECERCESSFPLDPLRYTQFEMMQEIFENELVKILGYKEEGNGEKR